MSSDELIASIEAAVEAAPRDVGLRALEVAGEVELDLTRSQVDAHRVQVPKAGNV